MRIILSLLLLSTAIVCKSVNLQNPDGSLKKTVWAHYTAWHSPLDTGFSVGKYYNYPLFSSSGNEIQDYRNEIKLAMKQGIDGFLVDLVGHDGKKTHYVSQMISMLKAAEGLDFYIGPCLDRCPKPAWQISELSRILKRCGNHPNYPKVGNKYVVATYSWYGQTPENWRKIKAGMAKQGLPIYLIANMGKGFKDITKADYDNYAGTYDMCYAFGYLTLTGKSVEDVFTQMKENTAANNATWMGPVWPGYIGAWYNGRNDYYQPHCGFDQALEYFDANIKLDPAWIHFTTWNDHDETPLMPMAFEFGGNAIVNKYLLDRWEKKPFPQKTQLLFAYHREEIIGTVLRIESLVLPGTAAKEITINGTLLSPSGKQLYTLPEQTFRLTNSQPFLRQEWVIPTAGFASTYALIPKLSVSCDGKIINKTLPAVMLKTGWIQNQATIKVPLDKMINGKAALQVSQEGNMLTAQVKFECPEKVVRAELWRNDRPIGPLAVEATEAPLLFTMFYDINRNSFAAKIINGEILNAFRKHTDKTSTNFAWTPDTIVAIKNAPWHHVKSELAVNDNAEFLVKVNRGQTEKVSLEALLNYQKIRLGKQPARLALLMNNYDNNVNDRPDFTGINGGELSLRLWSREKLENDIFYAQFETESGKIFFSDFIVPFTRKKAEKGIVAKLFSVFSAAENPYEMNLLQTSVNLESSSGASGNPNSTGYLSKPPFEQAEAIEVEVHPAALRAGRWTFDASGWDSLGERPITTAKNMVWKGCKKVISDGGVNDGKCLKLDGNTAIKLRGRVWPMGPCTIDFFIKPTGKRETRQVIIERHGWSSAFSFYLMADGKIEAIRNEKDGKKRVQTSMISNSSLPEGKWTNVRLVYDGEEVELYFNNKLVARKDMPLNMVYGNCIVAIGSKTNGFQGKFDDLTILSYPVKPESHHFPPPLTTKQAYSTEKLTKNEEINHFLKSPNKGNEQEMKVKKLISMLGIAAATVASNTNAAEVKLGKLIKKVASPEKSESCTFVKGNPADIKGPDSAKKPVVTLGEKGAFCVSIGLKSREVQKLFFPFTIKDGQELVIKVNKVLTSGKENGWVATFIGVDQNKKYDYTAALSSDRVYFAERKPKWQPVGGGMKLKYPATLQIRRLNGVLTFLINGSPRFSLTEKDGAIDRPYIYIMSQKTAGWSILDIGSVELREVDKAFAEKMPKAVVVK